MAQALETEAVAVKLISELGAKAAEVQVFNLPTKDLADPGLPETVPMGWDPKGSQIISLALEMEKYRRAPKRRLGTAKALTLDSFIEMTNRHKTEHSVVFANTDWTKPSFTAVIDYHEVEAQGAANFGKHRVLYDFPLSEEWKAWVEKDGEAMSQLEFATFLEDRIADLSSPTEAEKIELERVFSTTVATPSELIQLSRKLQVHVENKVANAHTLQNGTGQIVWEEQHKGADGRPLIVPGIFLLSISPFFMGERARIPVRLRYRVSGALTWFFQVYRPDVHVTDRVRTDLDIVQKRVDRPCYEGAPEMAA